MSKKKNNGNDGYKITSKKTGKSVKVTKKQANTAKKAAKSAFKKMPKKKRAVAAVIVICLLAAFVYIFDVAVLPLEYIPAKLTRQNSFLGEEEMKVHFVDVGQGDCIIIEFPDKTTMIIDSGDRKSSVRQHILKYCAQIGIKHFDYMVLTHSGADHVGGFSAVLEYFEVRNIYMPDIKPEYVQRVSKTYSKFVADAENETYTDENGNRKKAQIIKTVAGDLFTSTDNNNQFVAAVLSPFPSRYETLNNALAQNKATAAQKNDVSAVLYIEYLNVRFLLMGDANIAVEEEIISYYNGGIYDKDLDGDGALFEFAINLENIQVLKSGHHGSDGSSGEKLFSLTRPQFTIVNASANNSYGHPGKTMLKNAAAVNSAVYETSKGGDITASVAPSENASALKFNFSKKNVYKDNDNQIIAVAYVFKKYAA